MGDRGGTGPENAVRRNRRDSFVLKFFGDPPIRMVGRHLTVDTVSKKC